MGPNGQLTNQQPKSTVFRKNKGQGENADMADATK